MAEIPTTAAALKACPFCAYAGSLFTEQQKHPPRAEWFAVECHNCGAIGPDERTKGEAAMAWNLRGAENHG